jgi:hypothetical protein
MVEGFINCKEYQPNICVLVVPKFVEHSFGLPQRFCCFVCLFVCLFVEKLQGKGRGVQSQLPAAAFFSDFAHGRSGH